MYLGVDTAGSAGGVALRDASGAGTSLDLGERGRHAERLVEAAETLVREAGGWSRVTGIAASVGPGSFTGIRVGMAAALGWAEALAIPAVGVGSLDIHALACYHAISLPTGSYIVSAVDVRRGEAVVAGFRVEASGPVRTEADRLVPAAGPGFAPPAGAILSGDASPDLWEDAKVTRYRASGAERATALAALAWAGAGGALEARYARAADARRPGS